MKLYFLRHADALSGMDDEARPLSSEGIKEAKLLGQFFKKLGVRFNAAYASPLVRAKETAEIVLSVASQQIRLEMAEALRNETSEKVFEKWLQGLKVFEHLLLVGHAPTLAERAGKLLNLKK